MRKDPVCGMQVDERRATSVSHQDDQDYYFCSLGCKQRFEQNPKQYMTQGGQPAQGEVPPIH